MIYQNRPASDNDDDDDVDDDADDAQPPALG